MRLCVTMPLMMATNMNMAQKPTIQRPQMADM